jgi:hypothetical protein
MCLWDHEPRGCVDLIFSSSPRRIKPTNIPRRRHVFLRRSCMFLRRRGAPFGPPYRVSHKCYAFPRRSCCVSTENMRVSTEKMHICTEKRLSVTEKRQYSTEKFDFHGITTYLYGEGACFYGEGLALMGHRRYKSIDSNNEMQVARRWQMRTAQIMVAGI